MPNVTKRLILVWRWTINQIQVEFWAAGCSTGHFQNKQNNG